MARETGAWLRDRLKGAGGLYNVGNAIGFVTGLAASLTAARHEAGVSLLLASAWNYIGGSPAATAITASTVLFFWSGEEYRRAWQPGRLPDPAHNRRGDLLSGLGAVLLGLGLAMLGSPLLAATSGFMHAAGKFGSASGWKTTLRLFGRPVQASDLFRRSVVLSRIPAILLTLSVIVETFENLPAAAALDRSILPGATMICLCIWAAADLMLARAARSVAAGVKDLSSRSGSSPGPAARA
ncbi:MAG: hypothetical protein JF625_26820 [Inquilinus limosus]|uniref:Uncharacterized protein n=1 Tax=Inquilinus limosus TaxID=171674 RepID=A0A952FQ94_9PROT|nr:hypothetical protein [Inquilinus limosus]